MTLGSDEARQARQRAREAYPGYLEEFPEWRVLNALVKKSDTSAGGAHIFLSLIEIAKRITPKDEAKLVEFVAGLQKNALVNNATGEPLTHEGYLVWTQLPALGYTAADEWHSVDILDPDVSLEETRHYENLIALLAQLSAAADVDYDDPAGGEMDFSFWSMKAFEDAFRPRGDPGRAPTDAALRVASLWFVHAADRL